MFFLHHRYNNYQSIIITILIYIYDQPNLLLLDFQCYQHIFLHIIYICFTLVVMAQDPYQSIKNKIRLPNKHIISKEKKLFNPLNKDNEYLLNEQLFTKTNSLVQQLNSTFQVYDHPNNYTFLFPDSLFPDVPIGQVNQITYEQKIITQQENTFKNKLSEEQLEEIAAKGEFKVKSNIEYVTLPYVWKINQTLFWGRQKVDLVWKNSLAKIYGMFIEAQNRLFTFIPQELNRIKKIPNILFSILFGKKSLKVVVSVDYQRQIFKDFWNKIMNNNYKESEQWGSALWNYLYVYYDPQMQRPIQQSSQPKVNGKKIKQRADIEHKYGQLCLESQKNKNKINSVHNQFNKEWNKLKKKVVAQLNESFTNNNNSVDGKTQSQQQLLVNNQSKNDAKILELLGEKKFTLYTQYMKQQLPKKDIPLEVVNAILIIIRLFKVIHSKYDSKAKMLQNRKKDIQESVKKRYPIKHRYQPFFNSVVDQEFEIVSKAINQEMYQNFLQDKELGAILNQNQKGALRQYLKLRSNYHVLQTAKKNELRELHSPSRTFYSNHILLPPYKVLHQNGYYSLKKVSDDLTVDTNTNFWKLKLYWMRIKTWSINSLIMLIHLAWNGPTGIRCLYGVKDFGYDMNINYQTGQIYYNERKTVIGTFLKVIQGLKQSRKHFEELPDLGLLGKNVSRYFNYLECYVFRLVFVGIIIVLIGYPVLIIVLSILSILFVFTVWAWMPIALLITYSFNIFVYQFESAFIPNRPIVRSIPILGLAYQIIKAIIVGVLLVLNLIFLAPLKSFFIFFYCFIQRCFRTILDKLLLFLFRKLGRTPSRDTSIARKISGPGMSKQFYMSINEEDVYVLIRSQLEQIFMRKFNELIQEQINSNTATSTSIIQTVLRPFNTNNTGLNYIVQNTYRLIQNYNNQYARYMARFPRNPSRVRFTQEQIDNYFDNTINIVKNFVVKYEIEKWIFDKYVLYEGMYDQLTRSIWIQVFNIGEQIFEPLQKLDARFKLEDQYNNEDGFNYTMKKNVNSVMRSLEGEVQINHHRQNISPFKHNLLHRQSQIDFLQNIWTILSANSTQSVSLNLQSLQTLFVPNLNIKQILIMDSERRQREIKLHKDIVDL